MEHVHGKDFGNIMLYALSTCVWCKKTKSLLDELGVAYDYEFVDLVEGADRTLVLNTVRRFNPHGTFPTLVIDNKAIVGFRENEIREALGK